MTDRAEQLQNLYGYVEFTDRAGRPIDLRGNPAVPDSYQSRIIRNPDGSYPIPQGWQGNERPAAPEFGELDGHEGDDKRLLDLAVSGSVYGVAAHVDSITLQTRSGDIYFAGPFTVTDPAGAELEVDPADRRSGTLWMAFDRLIANTIETAALCPETSELVMAFTDGSRLDWKKSSDAQGQFRARTSAGRQFWSVGDGTVFWFGGEPGARPHFFIGGPKKTD
ncbi:MAG: hypothetical protein FWD85_05555 [Microbacteriaceae bacterium]|nr:hypothetical protein [Microbacteriaceae bacterium]MCL2794755.1 hypothetical protein [Microbacteriaceae bacterium]